MNGITEKAGAGLIAAGLHVLAFAALPGGGADSRGAGGDSLVTLQGATPQIEAMVAAWTAPPETARPAALQAPEQPVQVESATPELTPVEAAPAPSRPSALSEPPAASAAPAAAQPPIPLPVPAPAIAEALTLPRSPAPRSAELRPEPLPPQRPERQTRTTPPPQAPIAPPSPAAATPPRAEQPPPPPERKPDPEPAERIAKQAQPAQAASQAQRASGHGGAAQAGTGGRADVATLSPGQRRSLVAAWGARIRTRIERAKRTPRGLRTGGRVVLRLQVDRAGALRGVTVRQSSGNPDLDAAAMQAVRRAGRFPAAPEGLDKPLYTFSLPVRFSG